MEGGAFRPLSGLLCSVAIADSLKLWAIVWTLVCSQVSGSLGSGW